MAPQQSKANPTIEIAYEKRPRWVTITLGLVLVASTYAAHCPAIHAGYIWDDAVTLHENPLIIKPDGFFNIWLSTKALDYWPLTSTMLWIEWRIWGDNPMPYHVTNIVLHAISAVILWRIVKRLGVNNLGAFLSGLLFAIHPVTVASTAWIAERKNVLSMALYLFSLLAYLSFDDQGGRKWYAIALLAATAALLAKTSVVALPVVLLLLIWWRHQAISKRDLLRVLPFFMISLVLGLATLWFQHHNSISSIVVRPEGFASRIASVGWVFWFYLYKLIVPINLAMPYRRWDIDGHRMLSFAPLALLFACFFILWRCRKRSGRGPLAALGSFVIVISPVLGLLDMAYARYSLVADHLHYPGIPGIMALIGGGIGAMWTWAQQKNTRTVAVGTILTVLVFVPLLGVLTFRQAGVFHDESSLWAHTLTINDRAWVAYNYFANVCSKSGNYDRAMQYYNKAISINPNYAEAFYNRGIIHIARGRYDQAIQDCTKAIELNPRSAMAYYGRAKAFSRKGDYDRAISDYTQAIELIPDHAIANYDRGVAYNAKGDYDRAIRDFCKAIVMKPDQPHFYNDRGAAYVGKGDFKQALNDHSRAIELKPDYSDAYSNRAVDYFSLKQYTEARADIEKCRQLGSTVNPEFLDALTKASSKPG